MIPWLIGAAVVGVVSAIAASDDEPSGLANTIKRVIKGFWQAVREAFRASISLDPNVVARRTYFDKVSSHHPQHINEEYRMAENGKVNKRKIIAVEEEELDESEIDDLELRAEINRKKAELTKRRELNYKS